MDVSDATNELQKLDKVNFLVVAVFITLVFDCHFAETDGIFVLEGGDWQRLLVTG